MIKIPTVNETLLRIERRDCLANGLPFYEKAFRILLIDDDDTEATIQEKIVALLKH